MGLQKCGKRKCVSVKGSEYEMVKEQNYATKRRKTGGAFEILALPLVLIYEILSRLPVDTLLSCKCVCKTFLHVITDPCFIKKAHGTEHRMILVDQYPNVSFSSCHMPDLEDPVDGNCKSFDSWKKFAMPKSIDEARSASILFGSCNGLVGVCFGTKLGFVYYICNPILGEYMALSLPTDPRSMHLVGFGFCPNTKQYKVIQFLLDSIPNKPYCNILTLGHDSWRRINNVPYPSSTQQFVGPSFNGYLHWSTINSDIEKRICSVNLENEEINFVPPPLHLNQDFAKDISEIKSAVFDGSFCISYIVVDTLGTCRFEICVMKDYGIKESWTKMAVINLDSDKNPVRPMARLLNNGIVLLGGYKHPYIYYDTRKGLKKVLMAKGLYDALDYFPSLISLKNVVGPEKVEIAQLGGNRARCSGRVRMRPVHLEDYVTGGLDREWVCENAEKENAS